MWQEEKEEKEEKVKEYRRVKEREKERKERGGKREEGDSEDDEQQPGAEMEERESTIAQVRRNEISTMRKQTPSKSQIINLAALGL